MSSNEENIDMDINEEEDFENDSVNDDDPSYVGEAKEDDEADDDDDDELDDVLENLDEENDEENDDDDDDDEDTTTPNSKISNKKKTLIDMPIASIDGNAFLNDDDEYDDDEDSDNASEVSSDSDDDSINYEKFDEEEHEDFIDQFHPESLTHNDDEVKTMCAVIRNEENHIIDDFHKTTPILSKFERARVIGQRAKQINLGATPFVETKHSDSYLIACQELEEKKIPFIVRRPLPGGGSEYWKLKDLELVAF